MANILSGIFNFKTASAMILATGVAMNFYEFNHPKIGVSPAALMFPYTAFTSKHESVSSGAEFEIRRAEKYPEYKQRLLEVAFNRDAMAINIGPAPRHSLDEALVLAGKDPQAIHTAYIIDDAKKMTSTQFEAAIFFKDQEIENLKHRTRETNQARYGLEK